MLSKLSEVTQLLSVSDGIQTQACLTSNSELFLLFFVASWEKNKLRRNGNLTRGNLGLKKKKRRALFSLQKLVIVMKRMIKGSMITLMVRMEHGESEGALVLELESLV